MTGTLPAELLTRGTSVFAADDVHQWMAKACSQPEGRQAEALARLVYSEDALGNIERAFEFPTLHDPNVATQAVEAIRDGIDTLPAHPFIGRCRIEGEIRDLVISFDPTGYLALYRYVAVHDLVRILASATSGRSATLSDSWGGKDRGNQSRHLSRRVRNKMKRATLARNSLIEHPTHGHAVDVLSSNAKADIRRVKISMTTSTQ